MNSEKKFVFLSSFTRESNCCEINNICASYNEETIIKKTFDYIADNAWILELFSSPLTEEEINNTHKIRDFNSLIYSKHPKNNEDMFYPESWNLTIESVMIENE